MNFSKQKTIIFISDGCWSHTGAVRWCNPRQEVTSGNEASTHSRGTRPAVPPQFGWTLKRISVVVPACVCTCVCVEQRGQWAASSPSHWPAFPHQPAYPSNEAVIQTLIQTRPSRRDEDESAACLVCEIRPASEFISTIYSHSQAGLLLQDV